LPQLLCQCFNEINSDLISFRTHYHSHCNLICAEPFGNGIHWISMQTKLKM